MMHEAFLAHSSRLKASNHTLKVLNLQSEDRKLGVLRWLVVDLASARDEIKVALLAALAFDAFHQTSPS